MHGKSVLQIGDACKQQVEFVQTQFRFQGILMESEKQLQQYMMKDFAGLSADLAEI
jgi:hypothetical protein